MLYHAVNQKVLDAIPPSVGRILDVGCGTGNLGRCLKEQRTCEVIGITHSEDEARIANEHLDRVVVADLNSATYTSLGVFDCIVCSHVLEHLVHPEVTLGKLVEALRQGGYLIAALPNALFWKQRARFAAGSFRYTQGGLMDRTHVRFFDWTTAAELVQSVELELVSREADGAAPLPLFRRVLPGIAADIDRMATSLLPGLFGFQFILVGRKR